MHQSFIEATKSSPLRRNPAGSPNVSAIIQPQVHDSFSLSNNLTLGGGNQKQDKSMRRSGQSQNRTMMTSLADNKVLQQARYETVQILIDQIFVEKEIENIKKQFASTLQFSLISAMRLFD